MESSNQAVDTTQAFIQQIGRRGSGSVSHSAMPRGGPLATPISASLSSGLRSAGAPPPAVSAVLAAAGCGPSAWALPGRTGAPAPPRRALTHRGAANTNSAPPKGSWCRFWFAVGGRLSVPAPLAGHTPWRSLRTPEGGASLHAWRRCPAAAPPQVFPQQASAPRVPCRRGPRRSLLAWRHWSAVAGGMAASAPLSCHTPRRSLRTPVGAPRCMPGTTGRQQRHHRSPPLSSPHGRGCLAGGGLG